MEQATPTSLSGEQALERLFEGNRRYLSSHMSHPHLSSRRRLELEQDQHPFAAILGCADSRMPPELIFDQGLGDLFVVRVAGNVLDSAIIGSLEYAAEHLGTPLILVLGHSRCGAITAVAQGHLSGHERSLERLLQPALARARQEEGDLVDHAVKAHAGMGAEALRHSHPILYKLVRDGRLLVQAAYYDLDTGAVSLL
jgi:carbonic anhydrase